MKNENLEIEIRIAKAFGFTVKKGTLYDPDGTIHGGLYLVHTDSVPDSAEIEQGAWELYCPHFSGNMGNAEWLLDEIWKRYGMKYILWRDDDTHHCSISSQGAKLWEGSGSSFNKSLAVCLAVASCAQIMRG